MAFLVRSECNYKKKCLFFCPTLSGSRCFKNKHNSLSRLRMDRKPISCSF